MYPGSIVMENARLRIVVPHVELLPLERIHFTDMIRWVLEANLETNILLPNMVDLWKSIIYSVYSFQSSRSQVSKAIEV